MGPWRKGDVGRIDERHTEDCLVGLCLVNAFGVLKFFGDGGQSDIFYEDLRLLRLLDLLVLMFVGLLTTLIDRPRTFFMPVGSIIKIHITKLNHILRAFHGKICTLQP